ncbi:MAG: phosphoribosyl-AMP cyclohydrolase [Chloroherpetonaceae bacterium]|nr:phosphoribosyl-AMP cyclohydrolase [Chloroherpetonaceae bacterium]
MAVKSVFPALDDKTRALFDQTFLDAVRYDAAGLVPVVAQDAENGKVLMLAYANRESLEITLREKKACYWSRSRKELWLKGATSGHFQHIKEILIDCDGDAIIYKVIQDTAACHTGFESCFFRKVTDVGTLEAEGDLKFDAQTVYGKKG